jgi:cytochrome c
MIKTAKALAAVIILIIPAIILAFGGRQTSFPPYVDGDGRISMPPDFKSQWSHLGSWVVTSEVVADPEESKLSHGTGIHNVYTQPESLKAFKRDGRWPDGAVLVLEASPIRWDDIPTGHVMYAGIAAQWFVMVKDVKGRFKNNPNWESGWGWALFKAADPKKNGSANAKKDCLGCHDLAKDTDYVFKQGYPALE